MAWATLIMIAALLAQFVLGMAANLFVTIPAHYPGASPQELLRRSRPQRGLGHYLRPPTPRRARDPWHSARRRRVRPHRPGRVLGSPGCADRIDPGRPVHLGSRLQRGQLPQLQRRLQLDDHGWALRCGLGLLHRRALPAQRCSGTGWDRQHGLVPGSPRTGAPPGDPPRAGPREQNWAVGATAVVIESSAARRAESAICLLV